MLTINDIKKDTLLIVDGLKSDDRPIPSTWKSFAICFFIPFCCIMLNAITYVTIVSESNGGGVGVFISSIPSLWTGFDAIPVYASIVIGLLFSMMFVGQVNLYFMIPDKIRDTSVIAKKIRLKVKKLGVIFIILNIVSSVISTFDWIFVFATPALMFLAIFFINFTLSSEIMKYGLGPAIDKLSGLISTSSNREM
ncbi:hypothetical protein [Mangrovibacter phragmitis]|uniref:hypothetical protein n=1 Tax=Mangrovibacter phragmitis TaxID=1691903 RepID=UPI0035183CD5